MIKLLRMQKHSFAQNSAGNLLHYREGRYHRDGHLWVAHWLSRTLDRAGMLNAWSPTLSTRLTSFLVASSPAVWQDPPTDRICLTNGILHIGDLRRLPANADLRSLLVLHPHTPDWLSEIQLPITWSPGAAAPGWAKFLGQVLPTDCQELIWEVIGMMLVPNRDIQQVVWFDGSGANGKSTTIEAITQLIGEDNTSTVSIGNLADNQFASSDLLGRLLNVDQDAETSNMRSVNAFKKAVGGDRLRAERKGQHAFHFKPFCRWLLSGNELPRSSDASLGFFRRWVIVPFPNNFEQRSGAQTSILAEITTEEEKSGALIAALQGLHRIMLAGKLMQPSSVAKSVRDFQILRDPLFKFIEAILPEKELNLLPGVFPATTKEASQAGAWFISKRSLYERYLNWCASNNKAPNNQRALTGWIDRNLGMAFRRARLGPLDNYSADLRAQLYPQLASRIEGDPEVLLQSVAEDAMMPEVKTPTQELKRPEGWNVFVQCLPRPGEE
jgi:P4 family phage/plasmid primase-like protien